MSETQKTASSNGLGSDKSVTDEIRDAGEEKDGWLYIPQSKIEEILKRRGYQSAFTNPEKKESPALSNEKQA
jgi:hypothetical protein